MKKAILIEMDYKGCYKRYALTQVEFKARYPNVIEHFGSPTANGYSDTLKPFVHIWCKQETINSSFWHAFFTDMKWGLPLSDIENNNLAYVDIDECDALKSIVQKTIQT